MRSIHKHILLGAGLVAFSSTIHAQKYSNEFLSIGVDARAQAMGGSVVASINDVTSGFWNPAGLARMDTTNTDLQITAMHAEWFGGIGKYDYAAVAAPIPNQNRFLGFSFIRFGVDGIPNTLSLYEPDGTVNYDNVTEFSAADYAFMLHYAQTFDKIGLAVGATPKVVHRKVGPFASSWGFGVDLGAQYRFKKNWLFGVMLKDITTTFNAWRFNFTEDQKEVLGLTGNEIPIKSMEITRPQIILGGAFQHKFVLGSADNGAEKSIGLLAELDLVMTTDGRRNTLISANPISIAPSFGFEVGYNTVRSTPIILRAGVNRFQQFQNINGEDQWAVQPNFGVGFRIHQFSLDYAITNLGGNSGALYSHVISLKLGINYKMLKRSIEAAS